MTDEMPSENPNEPQPVEDSGSRPGPREKEQLRNLVLFLPRLAALLVKLIADSEVSAIDKAMLGAAIIYIASPFDLIPDFVPVIGQLDDIYLVALCLLRLLNRSGSAKLQQYWDGPEDIVQILHTVTDYATRYLPHPVRRAVQRWVERRSGDTPPPAVGA